jgi:hypothetical protein
LEILLPPKEGGAIIKIAYVLLIVLILNIQNVVVHAKSELQPVLEREPFEKMYYQYGYKSVDVELKECEKLFKKYINLPVKMPPVAFTHQFARCNHLHENNYHFEIKYLNQNQSSNHYMIRINPLKQKLKGVPFKNDVIRTYKLKNGSEAIYGTTPTTKGFNILVFEKESWQYVLSVDKRIGEIVTPEVLIEIADSILQYESV